VKRKTRDPQGPFPLVIKSKPIASAKLNTYAVVMSSAALDLTECIMRFLGFKKACRPCSNSTLMFEMPDAGKDHGQSVLVGGGDHFRVAH
jgi:hypothetical protein